MEVIQEWWVAISGIFGLVVWALRVEFSTKANAREIGQLWRQRDDDLRAHKEARDATNEVLREIREDIKALLSRR